MPVAEGFTVELRAVTPFDRERLRRLFSSLNEQSRYYRFLQGGAVVSDTTPDGLVRADPDEHLAIVGLVGDEAVAEAS